ncbi:MAG TPA: DUF6677 family protein [Vicinamibacterales bacterium]|nr:DUF6677 family protein [Vicinamibacterales bacterium]
MTLTVGLSASTLAPMSTGDLGPSETISATAGEGVYRGRRRVKRQALSPVTATFLSFIWPGLGHAYAKRIRRALLFALPPAVLFLLAVGAVIADPTMVALSLLAPAVALGVIAVLALHALWRIAAMVDAWRSTRPGGRALTDRTLPLVVLLAVVVVGVHVTAGVYVQSFADAGARIFTGDRPQGSSDIDDILGGGTGGTDDPGNPGNPGGLPGDTNDDGVVDWNDDGWIEDETGDGDVIDEDGDVIDEDGDVIDGEEPDGEGEPGPPFDPDLMPPPFDGDPETGSLPGEGPINVLFIGLDSGLGRNHSLSDTLMVASYYPARDKLTMISIPRDTGRTPLYKGGTYPRRINTFLNYARANPARFPEGPVAALMRQVGYVLGTKIHFYAATNLEGLPRAVDAVGGVTITVDKAIHSVKSNYHVEPGTYHFNGAEALRFARVRYGSSDFARARRQQQVIKALAARARDPGVAARLPQVIDAISEVVRTNVPREQTPTLLRILERANDAATENIVLRPNKYARRIPKTEIRYYMTELNIAAVRNLSLRVFGSYSRYR